MDTQWKNQQWAEVQVASRTLADLEHSRVESYLPSQRGWNISINAIWEISMKWTEIFYLV